MTITFDVGYCFASLASSRDMHSAIGQLPWICVRKDANGRRAQPKKVYLKEILIEIYRHSKKGLFYLEIEQDFTVEKQTTHSPKFLIDRTL